MRLILFWGHQFIQTLWVSEGTLCAHTYRLFLDILHIEDRSYRRFARFNWLIHSDLLIILVEHENLVELFLSYWTLDVFDYLFLWFRQIVQGNYDEIIALVNNLTLLLTLIHLPILKDFLFLIFSLL